MKSLEPEDKVEYLETILDRVSLNEDAETRLREGIDATELQDTFESFRSSDPNVWIEKTYLEGRDYKQSGDYALGKAIYSPSQSRGGQDIFKTMREAEVGDVVLHLLQEDGEIVGASRIESELDDEFDGLDAFGWSDEQQEEGGYLRWLNEYTEFETPLDIYDAVFENDQYTAALREIRESHTHLPYDTNLELAQGTYLARCPDSLASILAAEHSPLKTYLENAGLSLPDPPEGGDSSGEDVTDFDGIDEATEVVLERLRDSHHTNILADHIDNTQIRTWSDALRGFQPDGYIDPDGLTDLEDLLALLERVEQPLREIAADLNIGALDSADPHEVVFLALLRDLQEQADLPYGLNANQTKLNVLQNGAYVTFDNLDHPLVKQIRAAGTDAYALTSPPANWLTVLRHRAFGLRESAKDTWEEIEPGDILFFHAAGESNHSELDSQAGFVFGAAIAGRTAQKDDAWWYDEIEADADFPYLLTFDQLFVTPGAATIGDPPQVIEATDAETLEPALDALGQDAIPISEINDLCQSLVGTQFPVHAAIDPIEDNTPYGRAAGIADRLANTVNEISPVAIHRDFTGTIPASVLDDLHFPADAGIASADDLAGQITAALRAGDHIIFTGPPGTGKTEVAQAVTDYLERAYPYLYSGSQLTTATADWSTFDTVGGYMPDPDVAGDQLNFHPGVLLNRLKNPKSGTQTNEPTIIDEINRANIDKAFGQLFTTLSGQRVTLPYRINGDNDAEIEVVPADQAADSGTFQSNEFVVPETWRILGTMNTFDKTSLYEISYAFMRRFTFIRIGVPDIPTDGTDQEAFLQDYARAWGMDPSQEMCHQVAAIWRATNTAISERSVGPAIVQDILAYVTAHDDTSASQLTDAVISYIFPQLEGVPGRKEIVKNIGHVDIIDTDKLERAAADMLAVQDIDWDTND
ncbi:AAA family ATPase [Haloarcula amylolytica]|uniref:AAA family ATPase n=1 Tax=Haloarcula amylolytica TaxID=396317 RepID=UPI003C73967B